MNFLEIIWSVFFPLIATIIALIHIMWKKFKGLHALETFIMWQLAIGFGLSLLFSGMSHLILPDKIAESIGWPSGSPFQREVGMWDAAIGIVGLLCLKIKNDFWTAMIAGTGLFYFGAGIGHIWELVVHGNNSPNNAGIVMYVDLLYPVLISALFIYYRVKLTKISYS